MPRFADLPSDVDPTNCFATEVDFVVKARRLSETRRDPGRQRSGRTEGGKLGKGSE